MKTPRLSREERREQLADAALGILSSKGAQALTAREIASRVGITDGAIFRHFKDKEAILDAAVSRFEAHLTPLPSGSLPPIERLGVFFVERLKAVSARPEILALAFSDRLEQVAGKKAAQRIRKRIKASWDFTRQCIEEAQAEGQVDPALDLETLTWMFTGAMRGAAKTKADPKTAWQKVRLALFDHPKSRR